MTRSLEDWREQLSGSGLPAFAKTVREISHVTSDRVSSAKDLSQVIGRDAGMTSRLLQIANSSLFNFQSRQLETVSAAVVLLGFDAVRDLAVSVTVIDKLLKGNQHTRVTQCMSQAFHAAAQAKVLCSLVAPKQTEEVFVAALLRQVGAMAFWSRKSPDVDQLDAALVQQTAAHPTDVERDVLGFELSELSSVLAEEWSLGDLVKKAIASDDEDDPVVNCVGSGHELASVLLNEGWEGENTQNTLGKIAAQLDIGEKKLTELVSDNLNEVEKIAEHFGVSTTIETIQKPNAGEAADELTNETTAPDNASVEQASSQAEAQLSHLQQIAEGLENGWSRDQLMTCLVNGVRSGNTHGRCYFALLTPDRTELVVKYASDSECLVGHTWSADSPDSQSALANPKVTEHSAPPVPVESGQDKCLMKGIQMAGKPVGLLVLEGAAGETVTASFRQFAQQIPLILMSAA